MLYQVHEAVGAMIFTYGINLIVLLQAQAGSIMMYQVHGAVGAKILT